MVEVVRIGELGEEQSRVLSARRFGHRVDGIVKEVE